MNDTALMEGAGWRQLEGAGWRQLDRAHLDRAYNNAAAVATSAETIRSWQARSQALREQRGTRLGWRYGDAPRCAIDFFAADQAQAPLLVFFHGGYWQGRHREDFSFVAEGPLARGFGVALVGYTLAPQAPLAGIVQECREAVGFLQHELGRPGGLPTLLAGWSAGAHLAVSMLGSARTPAASAVQGVLAISGVYELEPIRHSYLDEALRLTEADADLLSPIRHLPASPPPMVVAWGDHELPALQWQSTTYATCLRDHGLTAAPRCIAGAHHFSILDELASPEGLLTQALVDLHRGDIPTTPPTS